ncbi:MAG: PKD domain-containing protein, partial [Ilumatobacteraceae bacterium]
FDVRLDGDLVIDNLDLVATPGHNISTMRAFNIVSDGTVNIVFEHGPIQNPLVNGIEIIRRNVSLTGTFGQQDQVRRVAYDGAATATQTGPFAGTVAWHSVRGAFMVNSTLFTLHSDGTLVRRSFDGTTFGPGTATYTYANNIIADAPNMTGIFFDPETSRIYYTLSTSNTTLYYRSFLPESGVISALRFTQSGGAVAQLDPSRVHGMFLADGQIWFGDDNTGQLMKIGFAGGTPTGSDSLADANTYWTDGRAMFLTSLAPVNVAPTAAFTAACVDATCEFDAAGSTDPDGLIANYEWDFGDGQIGLGSGASHTYAASGNYTVTLTVSDADLATGTTQQVVSVTVPGQPPPPPPPVEPGYNPLAAPSRILDTRADGQTVDALYAATGIRPLGSTLDLPVVGRAGVPADATAVVLNVTVTEGQGPGFITVFPCGEPQPTASSLNYVAGKNIPNLVISKIGAGGAVCFFNSAATHLVVDVAGFYTGAQSFAPLAAPARLLDTRSDGVTVDGLSMGEGIRPAGTVQTLQVTTRAGVPAGAASVVLNVTVDQPETAGFVTAFPCDATLPTASNVNFVAGQTVPNAVVSKLSAAGTVCLFTSATTHLVVDISGYFADTSFVVPLAAPARLLDTRADGTTIDGAFVAGGLRPTGGTLQLAVSGRANIPATASAVVLNVTVDQPAADGFITVYPSDSGRPNASNLNYIVGQTVPNAVIARLGPGGTVCLFNSGATHLVVDVAAYITGTAPPSTGAACPPDPA